MCYCMLHQQLDIRAKGNTNQKKIKLIKPLKKPASVS